MTRLILVSLTLVVLLLGCDQKKEQVSPTTIQKTPAIIEQTGRFVINPQFSSATPFSDGLAAVRIGDWTTGKWGYISR